MTTDEERRIRQREYSRRHRERYRNQSREYAVKYRQNHKQKTHDYSQDYYQNNKAEILRKARERRIMKALGMKIREPKAIAAEIERQDKEKRLILARTSRHHFLQLAEKERIQLLNEVAAEFPELPNEQKTGWQRLSPEFYPDPSEFRDTLSERLASFLANKD